MQDCILGIAGHVQHLDLRNALLDLGRQLASVLGDDELADLRADRMGFVFQTFNLMPRMSALRNVALPLLYAGVARIEREQRAREMLERLGLRQRIDHRPAQLSGGERQRVAIARALVNNPRVLLADEPTGNLDGATGAEILSIFESLHQDGHTLLVVTHSEEVASHAQRIIRVRDGSIEAAPHSASHPARDSALDSASGEPFEAKSHGAANA